MSRIPLLSPIGVRMTPAVLYALLTHLDDTVSAARFSECLVAQGVEEDAAEAVMDDLLVEAHRALGSAHNRPGARRVEPKVNVRIVVNHGCVWIVGRPYGHAALVEHVGRMVKCRFVTTEDGPAAEVTDFNDAPICTATFAYGIEQLGDPTADEVAEIDVPAVQAARLAA